MACWTYGRITARAKAAALILAALALAPVAAAAQEDGRVDILALGDSLTQGYGLIEQEGFVPQLRAWLAERGHAVRVVNGGVSGDTTAGGLARVEWSLTPEIDAMIVALGGNDLLRGLPPEAARDNIDGILQVAAAQDVEVLLVGMSAPGNYGPEYKAAFDAIWPELAADYDVLLAPSFFEGLEGEGATLGEVGRFMQDDGIHPNAEGVARIVEGLGPRVEALIAEVEGAGS